MRRTSIPASVAIAVGVLAIAALFAETIFLGRLAWCDAEVVQLVAAVRGSHAAHFPRVFSGWAAYLSAALVAGATLHAFLHGVPRVRIRWQLAVLALVLLLAQALKLVFERARPGAAPWVPAGGSFPSGHAANAAVCTASALRLLAYDARSSRITRGVLHGFGVVFVVAVACARLYLIRHWMTDVVAGTLLGLGCWGLSGVQPDARGRWIAFGVASAILAGLYLAAACGARVHLPSPAIL